MMLTTINFSLFLGCVELIIGAPLTLNDDSTTKLWEKQPRDFTTRDWEPQPRGQNLSTPDPSGTVVSRVPYGAEEDQESVDGKKRLLTLNPLEGGTGTLPPGAVIKGAAQGMAPPGAVNDGAAQGTPPPGAVNDGGAQGTPPPGAVNDGAAQGTPPPGAVNDGAAQGTPPPGAVNDGGAQGTPPPGAVNEGNNQGISMVPFEISKIPFGDIGGHVSEGPWEGSKGTVPPGAQNEESNIRMLSGARFLLRAFGL